MGYKLTLDSAKITKTTNNHGSKAITVEAEVSNQGVAPWYYDLDLVLNCGEDKLSFENGSLQLLLPGDIISASVTTENQNCFSNVSEIAMETSYDYDG